MTTKIDNRSIATNYSYDTLNRILSKSYTDTPATPSVNYVYDVAQSTASNPDIPLVSQNFTNPNNASNLIGNLAQATVTTGSTVLAQTSDYVYDTVGRLQFEQQCTPANMSACQTAPYEVDTYTDWASSPIISVFPANTSSSISGHPVVLTYARDQAERLTGLTSSWAGVSDSLHPGILFQTSGNSGAPAYGPVGLLNATLGVNANSGTTTATLQRGYNNRARSIYAVYNPGTTAISSSASSGTITISGSEAQVTKQNTHSSASIMIIGIDGTHSVCTTTNVLEGYVYVPITTCTNVPDTGTLAITVESSPAFTATVTYSGSSTDASIAQAFVTAFGASGSPVTAQASGSTVTLTSVQTGINANYALAFSNSTVDFKVSGTASMQGGWTAGTYYDSGSMTATVNGESAQVTWQQGSTAASLAQSLALAFNAGQGFSGINCPTAGQISAAVANDTAGYFTACASGGTVTLTSVNRGPQTDWAVSASVQDTNPTYFQNPSPSFSVSASSMSGGSVNTGSALYSFVIPDQGGYSPSGNLLTVSDAVNGQWSYAYDNLNRLLSAAAPASQPTGMNAYYAGVQGAWTYDVFGNRTAETWSAVSGASPTAQMPTSSTAAYVQSTNRVQTSSLGTINYDAAGNVTADNLNSYLYDAEGRICAVKNSSGAMTGYIYDAAGIRVAKGTLAAFSCSFTSSNFTPTTSWALGPGGEQVTEYAVSGGASTWAHSNVFAEGQLLATYRDTSTYFALNDWLGTKRVEVSATLGCGSRFRSLAFGNGYVTSPEALPGYSACADATEHHFTGKERDAESGNDYFGARSLQAHCT